MLQTRDRANAWIARFAPLVMEDATGEEEVRRRIATASALRNDIPDVSLLTAPEDVNLVATFGRAVGQLNSLETDLRRRLARLDPGDPEGRPDLGRLDERLQERLARQEVGLEDGEVSVFERKTAGGNKAAAAFLFLFGIAWTSFTTVHCAFMVGGLFHAFGFPALALLLFYSIFFFAGFAMFSQALKTASDESIALDGRRLSVRYRFGPRRKETDYELPRGARAEIADVPYEGVTASNDNDNRVRTQLGVIFTDLDGKTVGVARGATPRVQVKLRDEINDYLSIYGD